MGKLECKLHELNLYVVGKCYNSNLIILTCGAAGYISLHAVRCLAPEARHSYLQGEVFEHGLMVQ